MHPAVNTRQFNKTAAGNNPVGDAMTRWLELRVVIRKVPDLLLFIVFDDDRERALAL